MATDLLTNFGGLGSHGLSGAQASLCGTQPLSQRLDRLMELQSENLQFFQLTLPARGGNFQAYFNLKRLSSRCYTDCTRVRYLICFLRNLQLMGTLTWHWPSPADLPILPLSSAADAESFLCLVSPLLLLCVHLQPGSSLQSHADHPASAAAAEETKTTTLTHYAMQKYAYKLLLNFSTYPLCITIKCLKLIC